MIPTDTLQLVGHGLEGTERTLLAERVDLLDAFDESAPNIEALPPELRIMLEPFATAHCLHSTPNATANATLDLVLALASNRASVVGAQVSLEDEVFGLDTVVGMPVLVDALGWSRVECPPLTGEEQERLEEAAAAIRANLAEWSGITPEE
jgi:hypothetical protein